jgi:hypothetical protein
MSDHKFKVGQIVSYLTGSRGRGLGSDVFKIMQRLPRRALITNIA